MQTDKLIVLILSIGIIIGLSVFLIMSSSNKRPESPAPISAEDKEKVISQLFPEKVEDNLPQDSLEIPKEKWGEKDEALALRALKHFQENGIGTIPLEEEKVEEYKAFIRAWGKPWRLYFLKTNLTAEESQLIWDNILIVQANDPETLAQVEIEIQEKLQRVTPPVEVDPSKFKDFYSNASEVEQAIKEGNLLKLSTNEFLIEDDVFVSKELHPVLSDLDLAIESTRSAFRITSSVRPLDFQALLRKLGYPAVKASYHNVGNAIDLGLAEDVSKDFQGFLEQKLANEKTKLDEITEMYNSGTQPTLDNLINLEILPQDSEVTKAYLGLKETILDTKLELIDETPFFIGFSEDGNVTNINPVIHIQLIE